MFFVVGYVAKKLEPYWDLMLELRGIKKKTFKESIKDLPITIAPLVIAFIISYYLQQYFIIFPPLIDKILAQDILKLILTLDGILIGFIGVIFSQFLTAIHNKGNILFQKSLDINPDVEKINEEIKKLKRNRSSLMFLIIYNLFPFLLSIFYSINKYSLTNDVSKTSEIINDPIIWFVTGVVMISFTIYSLSELPSEIKPKSIQSKNEPN